MDNVEGEPSPTRPGLSEDDRGRLWVPPHQGDHYLTVLARLHATLGPRTYLEIGCSTGDSLALAPCASLVIDPDPQITDLTRVMGNKPSCAVYRMTADAFFASHDPIAILGDPVEIAFLDGLHLCEFLLRDFLNTERFCRPDSIIVMHDCLPIEWPMAERQPGTPPLRPEVGNAWTGDIWRTALALRRHRPDLSITALSAPPTGLVCVTRLDPTFSTRPENWEACVRDMLSLDLAEIGLEQVFAELGVAPTDALGTTPPEMWAFLEGEVRASAA